MDLRNDILPHRDRLYRLALGITRHTAEAEDVVQETIIRAWERRAEWSGLRHVEAWLALICRNLALDRRKKARRELSDGATADAVSHDTPAATLETTESLALLADFMEQLPPPQNEVLRLRDVEGLSYRDIARQLDLTEDQVRSHLHRARLKLRQRYAHIYRFGL